jgi:hypothetical protein
VSLRVVRAPGICSVSGHAGCWPDQAPRCARRRWEAHLWVKELGRQVYLGGYEAEEHAAEAYDVAALKCKGARVRTNFPLSRCAPRASCPAPPPVPVLPPPFLLLARTARVPHHDVVLCRAK